MKVALLTNFFAPYRIGFFNELSRLCDLVVLADSLESPSRPWRVDPSQFKFSYAIADAKDFAYELKRKDLDFTEPRVVSVSAHTIPLLRRHRPDVVVSGEFGMRSVQAALYARWRSIPLILWWEGTRLTEKRIGLARRWLRRWILRQTTRAWSNGKLSTEYLAGCGFEAAGCDEGMTGVDTGRFRTRVEALLATRAAIRQRLGLTGQVFLFCGSLSRRKGTHLLLEALTRAAPQLAGKASVLFVGDGEQRPQVEHWKTAHPELPVRVTGFVQPEELFPYYAAADVFTLPTVDDNWPLVTLEALVSGLPQIFSSLNGASADLARPETGVVCDPFDTGAFAGALAGALDWGGKRLAPELTAHFSDYYSPQRQAQRALASCEKALHGFRS